MAERTLVVEGLELSRAERIRVWAMTGPPGRVWSFLLDLGTMFVALLAYLIERAQRRLRRQSSAA
jgi:hypothetical protein